MTIAFILSLIYSRFIKVRDLKLLRASAQRWMSERKQTHAGVNYRIQLTAKKSSDNMLIDQLWVNNKLLNVTVINVQESKPENKKKEKSTVYIYAENKTVSAQNYSEEKNIPKKYRSIAVLSYKVKDKRRYFPIKKLDMLPFEARA